MRSQRGVIHLHIIPILTLILLIFLVGERLFKGQKDSSGAFSQLFSSKDQNNHLDMTQFSPGDNAAALLQATPEELRGNITAAVDKLNRINRIKAELFLLGMDTLTAEERDRATNKYIKSVNEAGRAAAEFVKKVGSDDWKRMSEAHRNREIITFLESSVRTYAK